MKSDAVKRNVNDVLGVLFTPEEVAAYFRVTPMTIHTWFKEGKLEGHVLTQGKRKRTIRFDPEQIKRFSHSHQDSAA